jgi:hypothetical protein
MLVLPSIAWAFGLAALIAPARARYPRTTVGAVVALIALGFASFHLGLGSYERASLRANRVIREIRRMASPGSRTLLLAVENPRTGEGIHPSLTFFEGCHVLSAGLFSATRPPFEPSPGRHIEPLYPTQIDQLNVLLGDGVRITRPNILRFSFEDREPKLYHLATAGYYGGNPQVSPAHNSEVAKDWVPVFDVVLASGLSRHFHHGSIHVFEPTGSEGIAEFARDNVEFHPESAELNRIRIVNPEFQFQSRHATFRSPLSGQVLSNLPHGMFLWWIELRRDDQTLLRSPYNLVRVR